MDWIPVAALYANPFVAMWFFVNLVKTIKKIHTGEDYDSNLVWGCIAIGWIVFSTTFLIGTR